MFVLLFDVVVYLVWKLCDVVVLSSGFVFVLICMFDDCLLFDVICILGGIGINELLFDVEMIVFV